MTELKSEETNREKHITPLSAKDPPKKGKLRIAAYCRVSTDRQEQEGSLENQQNFFRKCIDLSDREELVGIYADRGFSGTRADLCRHSESVGGCICADEMWGAGRTAWPG